MKKKNSKQNERRGDRKKIQKATEKEMNWREKKEALSEIMS